MPTNALAKGLRRGTFTPIVQYGNHLISLLRPVAEMRVKRADTRAHNSNADENGAAKKIQCPAPKCCTFLVDAHVRPMRDYPAAKIGNSVCETGNFRAEAHRPLHGTPTTIGIARRLS